MIGRIIYAFIKEAKPYRKRQSEYDRCHSRMPKPIVRPYLTRVRMRVKYGNDYYKL